MKVWFDPEGDLLEVELGKPRKGFFKDAGEDAFIRVDTKGNVIGFAILNVTKRKKGKRSRLANKSILFSIVAKLIFSFCLACLLVRLSLWALSLWRRLLS